MANHYFQFKQFKIEQEKSAMKVCTDSCLFGAWIQVDGNTETILDIGTGTGLLSLMLAQKSEAEIYGIEIEESAYLQTQENFENSVWRNRLHACLGDIRSFEFPNTFDFIVCNPPFYDGEVGSDEHKEKIAKHSLHLTLSNLLSSIEKILNNTGKFAVLLPYYRKDEMEKLASGSQFYPEKTIFIQQTPRHNFFRYAAIFSRHQVMEKQHQEISIKNLKNEYSEAAISLLQPYYLHL